MGNVSFGVYCRIFAECFIIIQAKSLDIDLIKFNKKGKPRDPSLQEKIDMCKDANIFHYHSAEYKIYGELHTLRQNCNTVAHYYHDTKTRFMSPKSRY